jgi:LysM repeat protein
VEGVLQSDTFEQAWQIALAQIANEHWYRALSILSRWYNNPDLSNQQQQQLLDLLDPIAGKVIYSADHLIEAPYDVRPGDSLVQIAHRFDVPANLLAKINGIDRPEELTPGVTLKIVPGPFRAEVDLNRDELTLFVGELYAGRFQFVASGGPGLSPGDYRIADHAPRQAREPADLQNGVGEIWLQRKDNTDRYRGALADDTRLACISLSPMDANDVRDILSEGSVVLVRR